MGLAAHVTRMRGRSGAYRVLVGDLREKTLGRPIRGWGYIKMDFKEVRRRGMDWIDPVQKRTGIGHL